MAIVTWQEWECRPEQMLAASDAGEPHHPKPSRQGRWVDHQAEFDIAEEAQSLAVELVADRRSYRNVQVFASGEWLAVSA